MKKYVTWNNLIPETISKAKKTKERTREQRIFTSTSIILLLNLRTKENKQIKTD